MNSLWCRSLLIHGTEKLLADWMVWTDCDLLAFLWEHFAKKESKLNQSNDFQHLCSRSFICSHWEFECCFDRRDETHTVHCCPHDSSHLIWVFFFLCPSLSGSFVPDLIVSMTHQMWLHLQSDESVGSIGFKINYKGRNRSRVSKFSVAQLHHHMQWSWGLVEVMCAVFGALDLMSFPFIIMFVIIVLDNLLQTVILWRGFDDSTCTFDFCSSL